MLLCRLALLGAALGVLTGPAAAHEAYSIAADAQGNVYFLDWPTKRLMRAAPDGRLSVVAELGPHAPRTDPHALAMLPDGNLVVGATYASRAWTVTPAGKVTERPIAKRVGDRTVLNLCARGDTLFLVTHDERDWRVLRLPASGPAKELFRCGRKERNFYGGSMGVDAGGTVVLSVAHRLLRVADGRVEVVAGAREAGFADGPVKTARFSTPWGVWGRSDGSLLVADHDNGRIRLVADGKVTTFAGSGKPGGRDGDAAKAEFDSPYAVCGGTGGVVFVAEYPRAMIRIRVIAGGVVTTRAALKTR